MARLLILFIVLFLLVAFVRQLRNYFVRDNKLEELREVELEGDLVDIDLEIAEERARQRDVSYEIKDIYPPE